MAVLLRHIDRERARVHATRAAIREAVQGFLARLAKDVAAAVRDAPAKVAKGPHDDDPVDDALDDADWDSLYDAVEPALEAMAKDGAQEALRQVDSEVFQLLYQANARAIDWSRERSGELVTAISETTRERVKALVAEALEEGISNGDLADRLEEAYWFGGDRAETIARTETAFADVQGNVIGWKASGVVAGKEWLTSQEDPCERCAALDHEVVGIDDDFDEGDPPLHPNCECTVLPVLDEGEQD